MMREKKNLLGVLLLILMTAVTATVLLRGQSPARLQSQLKSLKPAFLLLGLALMFGYVGAEALCTKQILTYLGHRVPYSRCLGYSFVGFYVSSVTPSATGGQPAQIYYMNRDGIPPAHGALNMMLIASCYQTAALIWGGGTWLLLPSAREAVGKGWNLLLLYGSGIMFFLILGMAMLMFLPGPSRRLCRAILKLLTCIRLIKKPEEARGRLDNMLTEYTRGADCIKRNPGLTVRVLVLCLIQQSFLFSVPWAVYLAFGLKGARWFQIAGLQALVSLAVCNLPLPGAVGPAEGAFVSFLAPVFGSGLVTSAMLVSRGISFYAFLAVSFLASIAVHLRTARAVRERALREMTAEQTGERVKAVREYLRGRKEENL